jgi:hypothetical protein
VDLDELPKPPVLAAIAREDGDEAAALLGDVGEARAGAELAVGDV